MDWPNVSLPEYCYNQGHLNFTVPQVAFLEEPHGAVGDITTGATVVKEKETLMLSVIIM